MLEKLFAEHTTRLARVTRVWPEGRKIDCIYLDTGDYGRGVLVASPYAGSDFGLAGIPSPEEEGDDENMSNDPDRRTIVAVVQCLHGMSIATGFVFPHESEMTFDKEEHKNRLIERHPSDFYRTINDNGDMDMVHPSGAHFRIGNGSEPDELEGKDFFKRWKIKRNKSRKATVSLKAEDSLLKMSPGGLTDLKTKEMTTDASGTLLNTGAAGLHAEALGSDLDMNAAGVTASTAASTLNVAPTGVAMTGPTVAMTAPLVSMTAPLVNMTGNATIAGVATILTDIMI